MGYSPWGHTESDTTEQLILSLSKLESQSFNSGFTHVSMTLCPPSSSTEIKSGIFELVCNFSINVVVCFVVAIFLAKKITPPT